jgi:hypothetical protein
MVIQDKDLPVYLKNRIIQETNFNGNSELFIYQDQVLKIYSNNEEQNLHIVKLALERKDKLKRIKELVLPNEFIIYCDHIIGFSMPYIKGITLNKAINDNTYDNNTMYDIFIRLLEIIDSFKSLDFDFSIGDLHEHNVIVDENLGIHIIDCDSFVIDNYKVHTNGFIRLGKYLNGQFDNETLEKNINFDYYNLLCMILNYIFKEEIFNPDTPVEFIKNDDRFKELEDIYIRTLDIEHFILTKEDIKKIFTLKDKIPHKEQDYEELYKEIARVRKIVNNIK